MDTDYHSIGKTFNFNGKQSKKNHQSIWSGVNPGMPPIWWVLELGFEERMRCRLPK